MEKLFICRVRIFFDHCPILHRYTLIATDAGVVGDYTKAQIIVRDSASGFVTGILRDDDNFISEQQLSTLNATKGLSLIIALAWPTRLFIGEVVFAGDNSASGFNTR